MKKLTVLEAAKEVRNINAKIAKATKGGLSTENTNKGHHILANVENSENIRCGAEKLAFKENGSTWYTMPFAFYRFAISLHLFITENEKATPDEVKAEALRLQEILLSDINNMDNKEVLKLKEEKEALLKGIGVAQMVEILEAAEAKAKAAKEEAKAAERAMEEAGKMLEAEALKAAEAEAKAEAEAAAKAAEAEAAEAAKNANKQNGNKQQKRA